MFKKLKIQLVMINLTLICLILASVFIGINLYMKHISTNRALAVLQIAAQDIDELRSRLSSDTRAGIFGYFYIITNENGQIVEVSGNAPAEQESLAKLVLEKTNNDGILTINQSQLWYLKAPQSNGNLLLFLSDEGSNAFLNSLRDISLIIGGASALFALLISILLANRALRPVHSAWEKQQTFVADASHELRTPLATLSTNLEAILDSPDEKVSEQGEWLTNMKNEITRMSKLVNDLLFLARADAKSDTVQPEDFFLSDTVKKASAPFQPLMKEKGLLFERDIQTDIKISGVEGRISQLIVILLDNAFKNTQPGGRITLTLSAQHGKAMIEVSDTGTGIPEKQLEHIFERFYRTDTSRARDQGGSGLGLSIARSIVRENKGVIDVNSKIGSGATFTVQFPLVNK